jgi:exonuclease III
MKAYIEQDASKAFYRDLKAKGKEGKRLVNNLLSLKNLLEEPASGKRRDPTVTKSGVPLKTLGKSVLVATWNIRELGNNQKYGPRLHESLYYIAEIISAFDVVAVQEVNEDLTDFLAIMDILGPDWKYLLTDITLGRQGNWERMAFVYDARKVTFEGFASQVVFPPGGVDTGKEVLFPVQQLARSPLMVGFRCNWFRFSICTVHIYYGKSNPKDPRRVQEIRMIARTLADRAVSKHAWSPTMILLGDFNIFNPDDITAQAITDAGFIIPEQLRNFTSGEANKHYDQMAFLSPKYADQTRVAASRAKSGAIRFYDKVFKDGDEATYAGAMGAKYKKLPKTKKTNYYNQWRSFQMSDHRVLWMELPADFGQALLGKKRRDLAGRGKPAAKNSKAKPAPKKARKKAAKKAHPQRRRTTSP